MRVSARYFRVFPVSSLCLSYGKLPVDYVITCEFPYVALISLHPPDLYPYPFGTFRSLDPATEIDSFEACPGKALLQPPQQNSLTFPRPLLLCLLLSYKKSSCSHLLILPSFFTLTKRPFSSSYFYFSHPLHLLRSSSLSARFCRVHLIVSKLLFTKCLCCHPLCKDLNTLNLKLTRKVRIKEKLEEVQSA